MRKTQASGRNPVEIAETDFIDVRDAKGRLWCRYSPERRLLEFRERNGAPVHVDLRQFHEGENLGG